MSARTLRKSAWCTMRIPNQTLTEPPNRGTYILLSSSLFYLPKYTKVYKERGPRDETSLKQRMFMEVAEFYLKLFELPTAQKHVRLRLYIDDSLLEYRNGAWRPLLDRMAKCPYIQLVQFDAPCFYESKQGKTHRGLLGAMMRFHALFADPDIDIGRADPACVCLVDFDNVYAPEWWSKQFSFARGATSVLAFTGPAEMGMHGFVPRGEPVLPFLAAGMTTFKRGILDRAATWDAFETDFCHRHDSPLNVRIDATEFARYQELGAQSLGEPLYRDFGYGLDEIVLNTWATAAMRPRDIRVVRTFRPRVNPGFFILDRVIDAVRWNGERSSSAREMAAAYKEASVTALIRTLERRRDSCVSNPEGIDIIAAYARDARAVQDYLRPHLSRLSRMYIDGRIVHVLGDPNSFARESWIPVSAFLVRAPQGPITLDFLSRGSPKMSSVRTSA